MKSYLLDTHPFIWWLSNHHSLSGKVKTLLKSSLTRFYLSSISILEIQYLIEIGKIDTNIYDIYSYIKTTENYGILPFDENVLLESLKITSFRDPFDRIILSTAFAYNLKLITKDRSIHEKYPKKVIW